MSSKKKILVVDDHKMTVWLIEHALKSEGYDLHVSYDGADALEKARSLKPDLMIVDLMMPVMNGYELCRLLKEKTETAGIPLLVLSALLGPYGSTGASSVSVQEQLESLNLTPVNLLGKPIPIKELRDRVATLISVAVS